MSKLVIKKFIQLGGKLSENDIVKALNAISKQINIKMKKLEYNYKIKFKLPFLSENNSDCIPHTIPIQTMVKIDGPLKGQLPMYTNTTLAFPTPSISQMTTNIPLSPFGPIVGIPTIGINPFGKTNTLLDRNAKAVKYLEIIKYLEKKLDELNKSDNKEIFKKSIDKTYYNYFIFVDLPESEDTVNSLENSLKCLKK